MERNKGGVLVTGGNGFLGRAIVRELTSDSSLFPDHFVRVLDLQQNPLTEGTDYVRGDVRDRDTVMRAAEGCEVVIHAAAIVDWGTHTPSEVLDVNFGGTEVVLDACQRQGVRAMIYTSSLDAVYTGDPLVDVDETLPYPDKPHSAYCESKAKSEVLVSAASSGPLATGIIRPADIYGEGDPYHVGSLIDMARKGFYVRLGDGTARCQVVYVGNVAHAHLLLARALIADPNSMGGEIYFVTDSEPRNFFEFFDQIVEGAGYRIRPRNLWLPQWLAYSMASVSEGVARLWRPVRHYNPKFSRFAVTYTCTDFTFNSDKARRDFGFKAKYSADEALDRTCNYFRRISREH